MISRLPTGLLTCIMLTCIMLSGCAGHMWLYDWKKNAETGEMELVRVQHMEGKNMDTKGGDVPEAKTGDLIPDFPKFEYKAD